MDADLLAKLIILFSCVFIVTVSMGSLYYLSVIAREAQKTRELLSDFMAHKAAVEIMAVVREASKTSAKS